MRTKESHYWAAQEQRWYDQYLNAEKIINELESAISALEMIALKHINDQEARKAIKDLVDSVWRGARQ
jgi:predicted metal-binding transcription factor (methanogenesis marker protein 9)